MERVHLSPEHASARRGWSAEWMEPRRADAAGRTPPATSAAARRGAAPRWGAAPRSLLGLDLDTIPEHQGRYDGIARRGDRRSRSPRAARGPKLQFFESPSRSRSRLIGFKRRGGHPVRHPRCSAAPAVAGHWNEEWWDLARGRDGVTLLQAFNEFGLDPRSGSARPPHAPDELVGYLEAHIEQGPEPREPQTASLELRHDHRRRPPVPPQHHRRRGAARRRDAVLRRRDALVGATARRSRTIERSWPARPSDDGCIATVGRIEVQPGAVNVIRGEADFSLDLRAATDAERDVMWDAMLCGDRAAVHLPPRAAAREWSSTTPRRRCTCAAWLQEDGGPTGIRTKKAPATTNPIGAVEPGRARRHGDRPG